MRSTIYILTIALLVTLPSCDSAKRKGQQTIDETQEKIDGTKKKMIDKKDQLLDKVFTNYDDGKPDTDNNKKRFKEHLQVGLTADVKNIYAFGDF